MHDAIQDGPKKADTHTVSRVSAFLGHPVCVTFPLLRRRGVKEATRVIMHVFYVNKIDTPAPTVNKAIYRFVTRHKVITAEERRQGNSHKIYKHHRTVLPVYKKLI